MTTPLIKEAIPKIKIGNENKLPISAIVVSCNEGHLLKDCLKSIQFCKQIVVVDLESTDNTYEIATKYATKVIAHENVKVVEYVREWIQDKVAYDWIFFLDPDEKVSLSLQKEIQDFFSTDLSRLGIVQLPWQFFFFNKLLRGTKWGGKEYYKSSLIHRKRVSWSNFVHQGYKIKNGFKITQIKRVSDNYIRHDWVQYLPKFIEKHLRYIKEEGKVKHELGIHYSTKNHLLESIKAFKSCFLLHQGYKDGLLGLFLSFFWMWYVYRSWNALKKYQKNIETGLHD